MASDDILNHIPPKADQRLSYGTNPVQFGELRLPSGRGPFPAVVFIHGGYWRAKYGLEYTGHICSALRLKGVASWNIEYRRVGDDGGGWPGTAYDIADGYRFLLQNYKKLAIDQQRIIVVGHSAGGQLALWLAANEPSLKNVMSVAGVVNLQLGWHLHLSDDAVAVFLGGTPVQVPEHYKQADPMQNAIDHATQWIVHGTADTDVPPEISRSYVAAKHGEKIQYIELQNVDHFDLVDPRTEAWKLIEKEILSALKVD